MPCGKWEVANGYDVTYQAKRNPTGRCGNGDWDVLDYATIRAVGRRGMAVTPGRHSHFDRSMAQTTRSSERVHHRITRYRLHSWKGASAFSFVYPLYISRSLEPQVLKRIASMRGFTSARGTAGRRLEYLFIPDYYVFLYTLCIVLKY